MTANPPGLVRRAVRAAAFLAAVLLAFAPAAARASAERVEIFVIDDFSAADSHGASVRSILERASARRVGIRSINVGPTLDRELYFEGLRGIARRVRERPGASAVVNLSFGSYEPDPREAGLLDSLRTDGVLVVAAAGNDGTARTFYPAGYPGVLAVGAVDDDGRIASYSNFGPHVALFAPGHLRDEIVENHLVLHSPGSYEHILTYRFIGGTSFAAPQVAGLVACLLQARPGLTPDAAVAMVMRHARIFPVHPDRPPATVLDARAVLAAEDPFFRRALAARTPIYAGVALVLIASLAYARGPGLVLALGALLWAGGLWILSRAIIARFGVLNGTLLYHAATASGLLSLSAWNFVATVNDRRREREAREREARVAAAIAAALGQPPPWDTPPGGDGEPPD
jgi:subtilisin family serine protease